MIKLLNNFWNYIKSNNLNIYNEFSLQHELGIYLRSNLPDYKVEFERNITFFNVSKSITKLKREIDIVVYDKNKKEKYAIELKYPRHGQHTKRTYNFLKDISFMEYLKFNANFTNTYTMVVVDNDKKGKGFRIGITNGANGRYQYFRSVNGEKATLPIISDKYYYSTTSSDFVNIKGNYVNIEWKSTNLSNPSHYYILEI